MLRCFLVSPPNTCSLSPMVFVLLLNFCASSWFLFPFYFVSFSFIFSPKVGVGHGLHAKLKTWTEFLLCVVFVLLFCFCFVTFSFLFLFSLLLLFSLLKYVCMHAFACFATLLHWVFSTNYGHKSRRRKIKGFLIRSSF